MLINNALLVYKATTSITRPGKRFYELSLHDSSFPGTTEVYGHVGFTTGVQRSSKQKAGFNNSNLK